MGAYLGVEVSECYESENETTYVATVLRGTHELIRTNGLSIFSNISIALLRSEIGWQARIKEESFEV